MSTFGSLFGWSPYSDADGLVSPQDAQYAQQQGQLGIGAGLLSAAGPSRTPTSFGQALSAGLLQGHALQNNALDSVLKRQLVASEAAKNIADMQHLTAPKPNYGQILGQAVQAGALTPQQAQQGLIVAQTDPQGFGPFLSNLLKPAPTPSPGKMAEDVAALKAAGITPTPQQLIRMAGAAEPEPKQVEDPMQKPLIDTSEYRLPNGQTPLPGATPAAIAAAGGRKYTTDELKQQSIGDKTAQGLDQLEALAFGTKAAPAMPGSPAVASKAGVFTGQGSLPLSGTDPGRLLARAEMAMGNFWGTSAADDRKTYANLRKNFAARLAAADSERGNANAISEKALLDAIPDINAATPPTEAQARQQFEALKQQLSVIGNRAPSSSAPARNANTAAVPRYTFDPATQRLVPSG